MSVSEMSPSRRGQSLPISPIRRLAPLAEAARARGVRVIHLNIGQPDLAPPSAVTECLRAAHSEQLVYAPSQGIPDVISAWRTYYRNLGIEVETSDILITAGASEALTLALLATCDPGDEVIMPEPFYAPYKGVTAVNGLSIIPVPLDDDFSAPTPEAVRARITPRTRAILVCSPNNPTGTVYTRSELANIGAVARDHGLFLLSDETYREIVFDGPPAPSALSIPGLEDHVVVIDSLSKRFNVCGLRIGSLVSRNARVMAAVTELAELRLAVPVIDQRAPTAALESASGYVDQVVATYGERITTVIDGLQRIPGVETRRPSGAFYAVARLPVDDAERFAAWLLSDFEMDGQTVMLTPMSDFYATPGRGRDEVRLACVFDTMTLAEATRIIGAGLARYPGTHHPKGEAPRTL